MFVAKIIKLIAKFILLVAKGVILIGKAGMFVVANAIKLLCNLFVVLLALLRKTHQTSCVYQCTKGRYYAAALIFIFFVLYQLMFINTYISFSDGWTDLYLAYIDAGKVIYKDFYFFTTPIYIYTHAALTYLTGIPSVELSKYIYVTLNACLAAVLCLYASKMFSLPAVFASSLLTVLIMITCEVDTLYNLYLLAIVLIIYSAHIVQKYLESNRNVYLFWAGVLLGAAFLTKQTTGGITLAAVIMFVAVYGLIQFGRSGAVKLVGYVVIGALIPVAVLVVYFMSIGIFDDFLFSIGPLALESKSAHGGLLTLLKDRICYYLFDISTIKIMCLLLFASIVNRNFINRWPLYRLSLVYFIFLLTIITIFCWLMVLCSIFGGSWASSIYQMFPYGELIFNLFVLPFPLSFLLLVVYTYVIVSRAITNKGVSVHAYKVTLFAVISFGTIFSHLLSAPIHQYAVAPALVLFISSLSFSAGSRSLSIPAVVVLVFILFTSFGAIQMKMETPYRFFGWREPNIYSSRSNYSFVAEPSLKLSVPTQNILSLVFDSVEFGASDKTRLFTFPHVPLFNYWTKRYYFTKAPVHFFDVCPDSYASEDAEMILHDPPERVVQVVMPEHFLTYMEKQHRGGAQLGQRKIINALNKLVANKIYEVVLDKPTTTDGYRIRVLRKVREVGDHTLTCEIAK